MIDTDSFGDTPAAHYLARALNASGSKSLARNAGRSITNTAKQVGELISAYETGAIQSKTVANCLRLMRQDISSNEYFGEGFSELRLITRLTQNIQIGYIKRAMRMCVSAKKSERVMANPTRRGARAELEGTGGSVIQYFDKDLKSYVTAGYYTPEGEKYLQLVDCDQVQTVTSEDLHNRSTARCIRLKKKHTL